MTDLFDVMFYELCPEPMRKLPKVRALSWALRASSQRLRDYTLKSMVNTDIDSLDIEVVDALAAEIDAPYYDDTADEETRRQTLKDAIINEMQSGTTAAVERMVNTVFGTGKVTEWFENGLDPYMFEIDTTARFSPETAARIERIIRSVKNVRSVLASITGIRDIEAPWMHLFGSSWHEQQSLLNDVNINDPDQAYPIGEYFALGEVSELVEDITLFREERERGCELPLHLAVGVAYDSLSVTVETIGETEWPEGIYIGFGVVQDTVAVLKQEA